MREIRLLLEQIQRDLLVWIVLFAVMTTSSISSQFFRWIYAPVLFLYGAAGACCLIMANRYIKNWKP